MAPKVKRSFRDRLQKSFLERNQKLIGGIGVTFILVFTILALLLQGGLLTKRYTVHAHFADGAGIRTGDRVTVAGLNAGMVKGVHIEGGEVVMDLGVNKGIDLPADSGAAIQIETLLGRRSVGIQAGSSRQLLQDGDTIPLSRTTTPVDVTDLNDISVRLLNESDAGAFNDFLTEVTKITQGKAGQVRELVTGLSKILAAVDARKQQLGSLLDSLRTLSTTLGERDQTLVSLIDNLNVVLGNLAHRQHDLQTLLEATDSGSHETADLVRDNRQVLDSALSFLHRDLGILSRHQLDLAATVTYLEQAVQGYSSVGYSSGAPNHWANIFVQSLGPAGVDALIGKCGAVDQFFDQYFGTDCSKKNQFAEVIPRQKLGIGANTPGLNIGLPNLPLLPHLKLPALPCTIDDLLRSALGDPMECVGR